MCNIYIVQPGVNIGPGHCFTVENETKKTEQPHKYTGDCNNNMPALTSTCVRGL